MMQSHSILKQDVYTVHNINDYEPVLYYPDYPASPGIVAAKLYLLVHFIFRKFILICFL